MQIKNLRLHVNYRKQAASLQDAFNKGYYTGSMTRWELMERIEKKNPSARWYSTVKHRGLWIRGKFICGIGSNLTIPKFSITRYDKSKDIKCWGEVIDNTDEWKDIILMRSWRVIFNTIKQKGYEVDDENLL